MNFQRVTGQKLMWASSRWQKKSTAVCSSAEPANSDTLVQLSNACAELDKRSRLTKPRITSPLHSQKLWPIALVTCHQFCQYISSKMVCVGTPPSLRTRTTRIIGTSGTKPPSAPAQALADMPRPKMTAPMMTCDCVFMTSTLQCRNCPCNGILGT